MAPRKHNEEMQDMAAGMDAMAQDVEQAQEMTADAHKRVNVTIHEGSGPNGTGKVFIGYNGREYLIKRGEKVPLPVGLLGILETAMERRYEPDQRGNMIERDVPRFSFTNHGPA